ncbi:hypothetical protein [Gracilibacillus kekensis]|uniref:Uncharacterized protein n=1 Tax=Gracilibacillus kekensis TaxID=1027249 RepID=A0A1M7LFG9_9BACI|nr:hypothetical protein [Gracilibacillus kekensis]SHM76161.1 hypothetical protein SAMN05216179_1041 [Gracilibacillus kekensis]
MENAKVKINVQTGDIELEGTEKFVTEQMNDLETTVDIIAQLLKNEPETSVEEFEERKEQEQEKLAKVEENTLDTNCPMGEFYQKFKEGLNDLDKALITAYFIQKQNPDNEFKTREVSEALKEHGIKLTNPSTSLNRLSDKKYIFLTRKEGKKLKYQRVSADGVECLKTLLR